MADDIRALVEQAISEVLQISGDGRVLVGSAIESITSLPAQRVHASVVARIESIKRSQSLLNALEMTEQELDELAANLLVTRDTGGKSTGSVRVYFSQPQSFSIPRGSVFQTDAGLRFFVMSAVGIAESSMQLNVDGGRYFLDVPLVQAEGEGDQYNVEAGKITGFSAGGQAVIGVKNLVAFSGGRPKESNADFLVRINEAVTARDLNIRRAIYTLVRQNFPEVKHVYSVGYGDTETQLDSKFGVHVGGEVMVHVESGRVDVFEQVMTGFSGDIALTYGGVTAQVGFIRNGILREPSKRRTASYTLSGSPASLTLTGLSPDTLDSVDTDLPTVIRKSVVEEAHAFPVSPVVGGSFIIGEPGRVTTNLVIVSSVDGTRYFCDRDFEFDQVTGRVTRIVSTMHTNVLVSYTWQAVLGVDYELVPDTGVVTAVSGGLLSSGDEVQATFSYFRVGRRDDDLYTIVNTPVRRIKAVYLLDADDNISEELMFVPPVESDDEYGWSLANTADNAPVDAPWFTWKVLPFKDTPADQFSDRDLMLDTGKVFEHFRGITSLAGFDSSEIHAWPKHGCLRYTVHEELALYFVNPDVPFDGTTRLRVEYEVPSTVRIVQSFLEDPERRVLCARQLARCFVPAYVNIDLFGVKGDHAAVVAAVEEYIKELSPGAKLRVSDVATVILDSNKGGATGVVTPFTLRVGLQFPRGTVQDLVSTGEIDINEALEAIDVEMSEREFVSSLNVKFLPGNIVVKT